MPIISSTDYAAFVQSSLDLGLHVDDLGAIERAPDNLWPNQYLTETASDGAPASHDLSGIPEKIVGYHHNLSRPGSAKRASIARQNTAYVPETDAYPHAGEWVPGPRGVATNDFKPPAPVLKAVAAASGGFQATVDGYAYGVSSVYGPTTITAVRGFTLGPNQHLKIPVPESFSPGTRTWDLYLRKNGIVALHSRVPITDLEPGGEYELKGPWRDRGRPPTTNQSGIGTLPQPGLGKDVRLIPAGYDLRAGRYRLGVVVRKGDGITRVSQFSHPAIVVLGSFEPVLVEGAGPDMLPPAGEEIRARENLPPSGADSHYEWARGPYKKNSAIFCRVPRIVSGSRRRLSYTYYVQYESFDGGTITRYRAYPRLSKLGSGLYFRDDGQFARGIEIHGYPPEEEPRGLAVALVEEEPPAEDTTKLEPPDSTAMPDTPTIVGNATMPAGRYLGTVTGVLEGGGLTKMSEPTEITITAGQIIKSSPVSTVNVLKNAEFRIIDANGKPEAWTPVSASVGGSPGYYSVSNGVLTIGVNSSTTVIPRMDADLYPVGQGVITVAGTVKANKTTIGSMRVTLRQHDADGAYVAGSTVVDLPANGETTFEKRYSIDGVNGSTVLDPNCASVSLSPRAQTGVNGTVNAEGEFWNLRILPFDSDVRYYDETSASFDAPAIAHVPGSPLLAVAPAPNLPTGEITESAPPWDIQSFESGAWDASWVGSGTATTTIGPVGALYETNGVRVQDASYTQKLLRSWAKSFTVTNSVALRFLVRIAQMPTIGEVSLNQVSSPASVRLRADGRLLIYVQNPANGIYSKFSVANVQTGDTLDLEVILTGIGTSAGKVSVGLGINGAPRTIVSTTNNNMVGVDVSQMRVGPHFATDSRMGYSLDFDQVVVTESGDILDREKPTAAPGFTPPPPDAPLRVSVPRLFAPPDEAGIEKKVGELYVFMPPGSASDPVTIPLLDRPQPVRPGLSYTFAAFGRWSVFTEEAAPGLQVWLEGKDVEPYLAAEVGEMSGKRGWHPAAPDGTATEEDDYVTFDVPLEGGYTHATFRLVCHDGVYVFQELLLARGVLDLFADRDARRGFGRAVSGSGTFVVDTQPPGYGLRNQGGVFLSELGVKSNAEEDVSSILATDFATSSDLVSWQPYVDETDDIKRYAQLAFALDGPANARGLTIPAGGVFLRTWHEGGVLLRADGSHFPGIASVSTLLYETTYPDTDVRNVGGHHQSVPQSEDINRMLDIEIRVFSEAALKEIEYLSMREELRMEIPGENGGTAHSVRFREQAKFATEDVPPQYVDGYKRVIATCTIGEAEVLEASPLQPPMKAISP